MFALVFMRSLARQVSGRKESDPTGFAGNPLYNEPMFSTISG